MGTDYLDRPLRMPSFPSHDTPVEIEDTPGSRLPADRPEPAAASEYRDELLIGVYQLLSGRGHASSKEIDDAVAAASEVIRKVDRHVSGPTPPTAPAAIPVTDRHVRTYLDWLAGHGPALRTDGPPDLDQTLHAPVRREMVKRRLAYWGGAGGEVLTLTAFGQAQVGAASGGVAVNGGPHTDGVIKMDGCDEAA